MLVNKSVYVYVVLGCTLIVGAPLGGFVKRINVSFTAAFATDRITKLKIRTKKRIRNIEYFFIKGIN